jgi:hypothetical protein
VGPKHIKKTKVHKNRRVDTSRPGVSATMRKAGGVSTAARNWSKRAADKESFALEDSLSGRPSRKSTRRSANRQKPDNPILRREMRRARAPKVLAARVRGR